MSSVSLMEVSNGSAQAARSSASVPTSLAGSVGPSWASAALGTASMSPITASVGTNISGSLMPAHLSLPSCLHSRLSGPMAMGRLPHSHLGGSRSHHGLPPPHRCLGVSQDGYQGLYPRIGPIPYVTGA